MSWRRYWVFLICVVGLTLATAPMAIAAPPLPTTLYGRARWVGYDLPAGTVIVAHLNGIPIAQGTVVEQEGEAWYVLEVPGDAAWTPGSEPPPETGTAITFTLAGQATAQTTVWAAGKLERLDLNLSEGRLYLPLLRSEYAP